MSLRPSFPTKTFPNHYAIITGLEPDRNGIIDNTMIDPESGEIFKYTDTLAVRNPKWYYGEPLWTTLRKNDIRTASVFWPGSEVTDAVKRPDYYLNYDHEMPYQKRIDQVINWLRLPEDRRPHFMTVYFSATDDIGHKFGPNSSQADSAIALLDNCFGALLQAINSLDIGEQINIILLSDHGMSAVTSEEIINIDNILTGESYTTWLSGPLMMIRAQNDTVYQKLKSAERNYNVYLREDVPEYLRYSQNSRIWPMVLIADPGYSLADNESEKRIRKKQSGGNHGYANYVLDMHGIFIAGGPRFRTGLQTGTLRNIDIYPLICEIFSVVVPDTIDGLSNSISYILN